MKVILLRDVARIGKKGSVAEVPDGYAMNQLIPSRSAEPATPANLKKLSRLSADKAAAVEADVASFIAIKESLKDKTLTIRAEANNKDHLFKAVSGEDVAAAAKAEGITLAAGDVTFDEPIKSLGEYTVTLVHGSDKAIITIIVAKK